MMFRLKLDVSLADGRTFNRGTEYFLGDTVAVNGGRELRYVMEYHDGTIAFRVRPEWVEAIEPGVTT